MDRTPLELYVACRDRSAITVCAFVEAFVSAPREVSIVRPYPEPSDAPQPMADVDELMRYLETGSSAGYSFSWINALPEHEHHQATLLYTDDGGLVAGLAGTFTDEAKALAKLATVVGGHFGYVTSEERPPLLRGAFIERCHAAQVPRLINTGGARVMRGASRMYLSFDTLQPKLLPQRPWDPARAVMDAARLDVNTIDLSWDGCRLELALVEDLPKLFAAAQELIDGRASGLHDVSLGGDMLRSRTQLDENVARMDIAYRPRRNKRPPADITKSVPREVYLAAWRGLISQVPMELERLEREALRRAGAAIEREQTLLAVDYPVDSTWVFRTPRTELLLSAVYWWLIFDWLKVADPSLPFVEAMDGVFEADYDEQVQDVPVTQSLVDRLAEAIVECPTSFDLYPSQGCTIPTAQELITAVTAFFQHAVTYGSVEVEYD